MSQVISSFILILSICQLSIGIWEAIWAGQNAPSNTDLNTFGQEIYGFTITKACCNILSGLSLLITSIFYFLIDPSSGSENKSSSSKDGLFQTICFGTSIWGLVRYFDNSFYDNLIKPYQEVLLVEMIWFFSIIGLTVLGLFFGCCFICISTQEDNSNRPVSTSVSVIEYEEVLTFSNL